MAFIVGNNFSPRPAVWPGVRPIGAYPIDGTDTAAVPAGRTDTTDSIDTSGLNTASVLSGWPTSTMPNWNDPNMLAMLIWGALLGQRSAVGEQPFSILPAATSGGVPAAAPTPSATWTRLDNKNQLPRGAIPPAGDEDGDGGGEAQVRFGRPTEAFSSGATMTLDPCNAYGQDTGEDNIVAYVQANQLSYTMHNSTTIPTTEVVPFLAVDDLDVPPGDTLFCVLGRPKVVITGLIGNVGGYKLGTLRDDWGTFCGTESDWFNWTS